MRRPRSLAIVFPALLLGAILVPGSASAERGSEPLAPTFPDAPFGAEVAVDGAAVGGDEIEGEIAIDLKDSASDEQIAELARTYGLTLTPTSTWGKTRDKIEM